MNTYARAAVVLAGDPPQQQAAAQLRQLAAQPDTLLLAADGGANALQQLGLCPALILGDNDSRAPNCFAEAAHICYPAEKDFTDGEAALRYACSHSSGSIFLFGALGGRVDHLLTNLLLPLAVCADPSRIELIDDQVHGYYVCGQRTIPGKRGDLLSLVPLTAISGLSLQGLAYPLQDFDLQLGSSRTMSNSFSADAARIDLRSGCLLAFHSSSGGSPQ